MPGNVRVWNLVPNLGCRVRGFWLGVWVGGLRFGVSGLGFGVGGLGVGVSCSGFWIGGLGCQISVAWCTTGEKKRGLDVFQIWVLGFGVWDWRFGLSDFWFME